ncbi:MAG: lipoprotein [Betaproteobacteria bacterium]|nr:lipoprotein [Betaproteobacteria bacterium]MBL8532561.1 lipoprotein [Betaproteobacteria bacterium]
MKLVLSSLLVVLSISACGLKGPLYLPPTDAPPADAKAKAEEKK